MTENERKDKRKKRGCHNGDRKDQTDEAYFFDEEWGA